MNMRYYLNNRDKQTPNAMTSIQKGIIAEPNLHASYLMFNVVDEGTQHIRQQLKRLLAFV